MPVSKSVMQAQVAQALAESNPGESAIATVHGVTGSNPSMATTAGKMIMQFFTTSYFITLTEQAVVFHKSSKNRPRPEELAFSLPLDEASAHISGVRREQEWTSFHFVLPGDKSPTRISVDNELWSPEIDRLIPALTGDDLNS